MYPGGNGKGRIEEEQLGKKWKWQARLTINVTPPENNTFPSGKRENEASATPLDCLEQFIYLSSHSDTRKHWRWEWRKNIKPTNSDIDIDKRHVQCVFEAFRNTDHTSHTGPCISICTSWLTCSDWDTHSSLEDILTERESITKLKKDPRS